MCKPQITFSTAARGQHLLLRESTIRERIQFPSEAVYAKSMCTLSSEITTFANQASLIWMRAQLHNLPLTGYPSFVIVPFSPVKPNLWQCVLSRNPSTKQWEQRQREKKEDTMWTCRKKLKKKMGGEKIRRRSFCWTKSLNNPSVIQETLSDGVHTNHKPTSAAA